MAAVARLRQHPASVALPAAVLVAVIVAVMAFDGQAPRLTNAGWTAMQAVYNTNAPATRSGCTSLGGTSSDVEVHGAVAICDDNVQVAGSSAGLANACAASATRCASDVTRFDSDVSALAGWYRWFAARLAPGACRTTFADATTAATAVQAAGATLLANARAAAGATVLRADAQRLATAKANLDGSLAGNVGVCAP